MNDFTISIDCKKIIEWMLERKKLPSDWLKKHKAIQLKMKKILEIQSSDKSINEYIQINKEIFNYSNVLKVCDDLMNISEAKEKNFFGNYSSPFIKEWLVLKELFQKDNLNIVDLGKFLSQNIAFEIPALKKNISSLESQFKDNMQKINDYKTSIKSAERDYAYQCEKIGIKGVNLEIEVLKLILELPEIFKNFISNIKKPMTNEIIQYYYEFTQYINSRQDPKKLKLNILEYLIKENDDLLDYYLEKKNDVVINDKLLELNNQRYDFYLQMVEEEEKKIESEKIELIQEINWDFTINEIHTNNNEINDESNKIIWEDQIEPVNDNYDNIKIEIIDKDIQKEDWEIIKNEEIKIYRKETLISNRETRSEIIENLYELLFFIKQRIYETKNFSSNSLLQAYDQTTTSSLFEINVFKLEQYEILINDLINSLNNYHIMNLFMIKDQPKAKDRIISSLKQYMINKAKNESNIHALEKKLSELEELIIESKNKLKKIIGDVVFAKDSTEKIIKELIKRDVFITGFQK